MPFYPIKNGRTIGMFINTCKAPSSVFFQRVKESPETHFSNHREEMTLIYVKLQDAISIISTIDSSVNSTVGIVEPETYLPYVDLSPDRAVQVAKELEKYLAMPTNSSPTMSS